MKVYRIIKADISVKVGEVLACSKILRKFPRGREKAENLLEEIRKRDYSNLYSRIDSIFVFPYDNQVEERAFQWASTYVPEPGSLCTVNLLELEVDNVEWHDSRDYEDLYYLLNNFRKGMRDQAASKEKLYTNYWCGKCNMKELSIEGLVNSAKVISKTPYMVTHNKIMKIE